MISTLNKLRTSLIIFLFIFFLAFISCNNNDDDETFVPNTNITNNNTNNTNSYFRAKMDGVLWEGRTPIGQKEISGMFEGAINIKEGVNGLNNGKYFALSIQQFEDTNYALLSASFIKNTNDEYSEVVVGSSNPLRLFAVDDTINKKIKGTFSFTLKSFFDENVTVDVTDGEFSVCY